MLRKMYGTILYQDTFDVFYIFPFFMYFVFISDSSRVMHYLSDNDDFNRS